MGVEIITIDTYISEIVLARRGDVALPIDNHLRRAIGAKGNRIRNLGRRFLLLKVEA